MRDEFNAILTHLECMCSTYLVVRCRTICHVPYNSSNSMATPGFQRSRPFGSLACFEVAVGIVPGCGCACAAGPDQTQAQAMALNSASRVNRVEPQLPMVDAGVRSAGKVLANTKEMKAKPLAGPLVGWEGMP
jgi:hypothetical protein